MKQRPATSRAAIDCGTNSTRLLIVDGSGRSLRRELRITRLGQGVDSSGLLTECSIERTLVALTEFRHHMSRTGVDRARLVATSAVRDARNGPAFLAAATNLVGVEAEILSGEEEGRLSCSGALAGLPPASQGNVVVDIGGGSTEIVVEDNGNVNVASLQIGCVRLTERYLRKATRKPDDFIAAVDTIRYVLEAASWDLLRDAQSGARRLVGVAGTVSTLAALELGLPQYDAERLHGSILTRSQIEHWCETLTNESSSATAQRPAIVPGREDIIGTGALILREIMAKLNAPTCTVSETDILDGLIHSLPPITTPQGGKPKMDGDGESD